MKEQYFYRARVVSVYDGDTITAILDLGFGVGIKQKLRLYGIDTPELRGDERAAGLEVRDYVREQIDGQEIMVETIKDKTGKYGRYLAIIWCGKDFTENLNMELMRIGYAKAYKP